MHVQKDFSLADNAQKQTFAVLNLHLAVNYSTTRKRCNRISER